MDSKFEQMFPRRPLLIGMIHVWDESADRQAARAIEDLERLAGFDGVIVENYGWGYANANRATKETLMRLDKVLRIVRESCLIPVGVNVLPNDLYAAFTMASRYTQTFVQLDHVTGTFVNASSVDFHDVFYLRGQFPEVMVFGGIHPKYYQLKYPQPITRAAKAAVLLTDAIVVTGTKTGGATSFQDLQDVRGVIGEHPLIVGSGLNPSNVSEQFRLADGAIVGSCLKRQGVVEGEPIDPTMVAALLKAVR